MKKRKRKKSRFLKVILKPFKAYGKHIKRSIIPQPYSHQVKMNILIKKGQQSGTALIPCTIYAMDHSIDLNPALIRKKDKKRIKYYKPGKKIRYDSKNYDIELTKDEKKQGYVLKELERCKVCGQKLVVAELKATRYRSCPSIHIKLGDPAKEDVIVPVQFGVNKSDITSKYLITPILILAFAYWTATVLGINIQFPTINLGYFGNNLTLPFIDILFKGFVLSIIWLYLAPRLLYKNYKLLSWYNKVKSTMRKSRYKKTAER